MKLIGFVVLIVVLFFSLFRFYGAELSNNVTAVALMVLLLSLFSDLQEFNFWGLTGKKSEKEKELKSVEGKEAIVEKKAPKVKKTDLKFALENTEEVVHLMDSKKGNFLELSFAIEKQLRIAAAVLMGRDDPGGMKAGAVTELLFKKELLTDAGVKQVEGVRWLRNILVHGRENELSSGTLETGLDIAHQLYMELRNWIDTAKTRSS